MNIAERNAIAYENPSFISDMNEWIRLASNSIRRRQNRNKLGKVKGSRIDIKPVLPIEDYCYHTGIRFVDAEVEYANPNDPRKRSIDHIIPLAVCYTMEMTQDEANHPDNLCWCLKCVNNVRGSTDIESFKPIANYYRQKFIDAGIDYI